MSYPQRPWRMRGVSRGDPYAALEALQHRMNRTFGNLFSAARDPGTWHPDVDVEETGDGWVVEVRLPGVAPEEVSVDVSERELCIRSRAGSDEGAQADEARTDEDARVDEGARTDEDARDEGADNGTRGVPMTTRSRRWSEFTYRLTLPSDIDPDRIDATMNHGLLTVHLPRTTQPRTRRIQVGSGAAGAGRVVEGSSVPGEAAEAARPGDYAEAPSPEEREAQRADSQPGGA